MRTVHVPRGIRGLRGARWWKFPAFLLPVVVVTSLLATAGPGDRAPVVDLDLGRIWLASDPVGQAALLDGTTGQIETRVQIEVGAGSLAQVVTAGSGADALLGEGSVAAVDGATDIATAPKPGLAHTTDIYASGSHLYLLDRGRAGHPATLAVADPNTLGVERRFALGHRVLSVALDGAGRLWMTTTDGLYWADGASLHRAGQDTGQGEDPTLVGTSGDQSVAVTDRGAHPAATLLDPTTGAPQATACLQDRGADPTLLPGSAPAGAFYATSVRDESLLTADFATGGCERINIAPRGDRLGPPISAQGRAFVPDYTTGSVAIVDVSDESYVTVSLFKRPLPQAFQLLTRDGIVYYNNPDGKMAGIITANGTVTPVSKYDPASPATGISASHLAAPPVPKKLTAAAAPNAPMASPAVTTLPNTPKLSPDTPARPEEVPPSPAATTPRAAPPPQPARDHGTPTPAAPQSAQDKPPRRTTTPAKATTPTTKPSRRSATPTAAKKAKREVSPSTTKATKPPAHATRPTTSTTTEPTGTKPTTGTSTTSTSTTGSSATGTTGSTSTTTNAPPAGAALSIGPAGLPVAEVGEKYDAQFQTADGTAPYSWSVTGLPSGLSADEDGTITGAPLPSAQTATITVGVTDSSDPPRTGETQYTLAVNHPPVAPDLPAVAVKAGKSVTVDFVPPASDPDGDSLTLVEVGDYSPDACTSATFDATTATFTPQAGFTGTCQFTYTVSDGTLSASGTGTLNVDDQPPTALPFSSGPVHMSTDAHPVKVSFDPASVASDPDGDTLTFSKVGDPTPAKSGTVTWNANSVTFTPSPDFVGSATFTYTVTDGALTSQNTATITLTDNPPTAPDQTVAFSGSTDFDVTRGGAAGGASDPDGDPLSITALGTPETLSGSPALLSVEVDPNRPSFVDITGASAAPQECLKLLPRLRGTVTYTVSDGAMTATGTLDLMDECSD